MLAKYCLFKRPCCWLPIVVVSDPLSDQPTVKRLMVASDPVSDQPTRMIMIVASDPVSGQPAMTVIVDFPIPALIPYSVRWNRDGCASNRISSFNRKIAVSTLIIDQIVRTASPEHGMINL